MLNLNQEIVFLLYYPRNNFGKKFRFFFYYLEHNLSLRPLTSRRSQCLVSAPRRAELTEQTWQQPAATANRMSRRQMEGRKGIDPCRGQTGKKGRNKIWLLWHAGVLSSPAVETALSCHTRCNPRIVFCRGCREQKLNKEHGRISEKTPK